MSRANKSTNAKPAVQLQVAALFERQQYAQALQMCEAVWLQRSPHDIQALEMAGVLSYLLAQWPQALAYQQRLLKCQVPLGKRADTLTNMALTLTAMHRPLQAEQAYRDSLSINTHQAKAWNNLGNLLLQRPAQMHEALKCYERAVSVQPIYPNAWSNLGFARVRANNVAGAEHAYQQALAQAPDYLPALSNYAELLESSRPQEALALYRRALTVAPDHLKIVASAVSLRRSLADWQEDVGPLVSDVLRLARQPQQQAVAPLHWMAWPEVTPAVLRQQAQAFARSRWGTALAQEPLSKAHASRHERRLRIGYISPDFRNHPVTHLVSGVIAAHDRSCVEVFLYPYGSVQPDKYTQALRATAEHWVDLSALDDFAAAKRIHSDGIDVLVDLAGFTTHARLGITALRPAPVIASWIGYVGTLGEPRLADYILADEVVMPEHLQDGLSEKALYLSPCFQPNGRWQPITITSTRALEGLPEQGVVLCSFNQTFKLNPQIWDAWCEILRQVPDSVLWIPEPVHDCAGENLRREMRHRQVDPARLVLAKRVPLAQHWGRIGLADLALDTYPYNSGTTASDMLRCGVPLVTCAGDTFSSRMGASLLSALGLPDLIAESMADYIKRAVMLSQDQAMRAQVRQRLGNALPDSLLFKPEHTARQLERLFEKMMQEVR